MAGDCPVEFILHGFEEGKRGVCLRIIVNGEAVDVAYLLVEAFLRCPNVPDTFEQFVEVIGTDTPAFLQPDVVQNKTLDQVLTQPFGRPYAELGAPVGTDPVADGEDHIEVVEALSGIVFHRWQLSSIP